MTCRTVRRAGATLALALTLPAFFAPTVTPAVAESPVLVVYQTGGGMATFPVESVEKMWYLADDLFIKVSGVDHGFPVADITSLQFNMNATGVEDAASAAEALRGLRLFQNRPNPFSPATRIEYDAPDAGFVTLTVFDVAGRRVRELVNARQDAGRHGVTWDGRDGSGAKVGGGVYFYRVSCAGVETTKRMVVLP